MNDFRIYDITSAPADSRLTLEKIKLNGSAVPNVYAVMAESPLLLKGYIALKELFDGATLSKQDRKVVLLTISRETGSAYDTAVHSAAAEKHNVPADVIESIRAGKALKDSKLEALRSFTANAVHKRGVVGENEVKEFLLAGYTRANILEIVLAAGMVNLTSYTNQIAGTPLDTQYEAKVWKKAS